MNNGKPVLHASDRSMFWWDSDNRIYVAAAKSSYQNKRAQLYAWSRDAVNWTRTSTWIHRADERDHPGDQGEAAYGFKYGGQYVGFCEMRQLRKGQPTKINWELMTSRDGRNWSRPIRKLFSPDGPKESWRYQVHKIFANPPIEQDGKLLIYYGGKSGMVSVEEGDEPFQALCLAKLRLDGFVSIDADKTGGTLITRPVLLKGKRLHVNANCKFGELRIEILAEAGESINRYTASENRPICDDAVDIPVRWQNEETLEALADRPVRFKFHLNKAKLFSFWVD